MLTRLESGRVVVYGLIAGVLVGVLGSALRLALDALTGGLAQLTQVRPPGTPGEGGLLIAFGAAQPLSLLVAVPLLTALAALLGPGGPDGPLEDAVRRYHTGQTARSFRGGWRSLLATTLAYLSGAGVGRDGPFTALGSLSARLLVRLARLSSAEARVLTLSCVGAALGLVLHAPLAAAVLIVEVLYRRFAFELEVLLPAVLASVAAYTVYGALLGFSPLVAPSVLQPPGLAQTPGYAAVALVVAGAAWLVTSLRIRLPDFKGRAWHVLLSALFGALAAGLIWLVPELLGDGSGWWQLALSGFQGQESLTQGALRLVLLLGVAWLALGGTVLSALSAGGLLGAGLASVAPALGLDPTVASLVGAAAFLTTSHNVPVAATLLISAWAGDALLPALFLGTLLAHALTGPASLLRPQMPSHTRGPPHAAPPDPPAPEPQEPLA